MADHDEDGIGAAARPSGGPGRVERVAEYLDLDCDGVPDAVLTTQSVEVGVVGGPDVIETVEELDRCIGDDGQPGAVEWRETVTFSADGDGESDAADVVALELVQGPRRRVKELVRPRRGGGRAFGA